MKDNKIYRIRVRDGRITNREEIPEDLIAKLEAPEYVIETDEHGKIRNPSAVPAGLIESIKLQNSPARGMRACKLQL